MGRRHYEPIDFFTGNTGFTELRARDVRKQERCVRRGVELHFVKYDEKIGSRATDIMVLVKRKKEMPNKSAGHYVSLTEDEK